MSYRHAATSTITISYSLLTLFLTPISLPFIRIYTCYLPWYRARFKSKAFRQLALIPVMLCLSHFIMFIECTPTTLVIPTTEIVIAIRMVTLWDTWTFHFHKLWTVNQIYKLWWCIELIIWRWLNEYSQVTNATQTTVYIRGFR